MSDSSEIVTVVILKAAPGKGEEIVEAFRPCIEKTHGEEGCLAYALHRDNADPDQLVHIERWRSQADVDAHFQQPYLAELLGKMGAPGLLAEPPTMIFASSLDIGDPAKGSL
jgi:quinol monooxygenase YgiN